MKGFQIILILSLMFCFQNQGAAKQVIKIRVAEFPPNYYKDGKGNWTGLGVELSAEVVRTAGLEPVFVELPWKRALEYVRRGKIQYMTNLKKTDERSAFMRWIGPVRPVKMGLIVKKGNEALPIRTLDDFITMGKNKGKRFGYQSGMIYTEDFHRRMEKDPEFRNSFEDVANAELNFRKVLRGRILGFFELTDSATYRIRNNPEYEEITIHPFVLRKTPAYHGVSKKSVDEKASEKLDDAFQMLQQNGELQRITDRYQ